MYFTTHKNEFMELVLTCLKECYGKHQMNLSAACHSLSAKFAVPLKNAKVDESLLDEERK